MALEITHAVPMAGAFWFSDCSSVDEEESKVDDATTSAVDDAAPPLARDKTKSEFAAAAILSGMIWLAQMEWNVKC
jgi:hypothetical protein